MSIELGVYRQKHQATFCGWCNDANAFGFLRKSYPNARAPGILFEHFVDASACPTPGARVWAIVERPSGDLAGHLELKVTEKTDPGEGELVVFTAPARRRVGVACEAIGALIGRPTLAPEFSRLLAVCRPTNAASLRLLARAGFYPLPDRSTALARYFGRTL